MRPLDRPGAQTRIRRSEAAALTTAGTVAATIFCCLPFATGIIGAGLAAFGARLAPAQPYLAGLSIAFLSYAFYQAYRPSAATCVGDACAVAPSARNRRLVVWLVLVLVVLLLTASRWASWVIYWTL